MAHQPRPVAHHQPREHQRHARRAEPPPVDHQHHAPEAVEPGLQHRVVHGRLRRAANHKGLLLVHAGVTTDDFVLAGIDAAQQEAAFELVNYLTGPEGMKEWTDLGLAMPTRESLRAGWLEQYPDLEPFLDGADYAYPWQFRPGFQDVLDTINDGLQQAFAGTALPEDVLENAQEVGEEVLNRYGRTCVAYVLLILWGVAVRRHAPQKMTFGAGELCAACRLRWCGCGAAWR